MQSEEMPLAWSFTVLDVMQLCHMNSMFLFGKSESYITIEALHQCIITNSRITVLSNCVQQLTVEGNSVFNIKR